MSAALHAALKFAAAGISPVPVMADGSKRPALKTWKEHQERRATEQEIYGWFGGDAPQHHALGLITGAISGNLEMAEIEGRAAHHMGELEALAVASGLGELWHKVCTGWLERSPSGGYHWFYRLTETPAKNTKLAARPATFEELAENSKEKRKVLTETRGEGGFVVTAPSNGTTHTNGKPWELVAGGPDTVPTLTPEELEKFHYLLISINEEPPAPPQKTTPVTNLGAGSGMLGSVSPLDDYEAKTDWSEILIPAGWRYAFTYPDGARAWTRPGKPFGVSATTGKDPERDRLFVFTSSTDFEQETPYTKQGAYAHLHHNGNHSAAASALRKAGYGQDAEIGIGSSKQQQLQPGQSPFAAPSTGPSTNPTDSAWPPATGQATSPSSTPAPTAAAQTGPAGAAPDGWPEQQTGTEGNLATVTDIAPRIAAAATTIAHTDDGNAALLIAHHGHELRYNPERDRWLHWTGNVWEWQPKNNGAARELAKDVIRSMHVAGDDTARAWKKKSLSSSAITNMLTQAQTDARLVVLANQLDANGWELNTPAGIIDLRTATIHPPRPESLHTKLTGCAPDFDGGESEEFMAFLETTFPNQREVRDYVQKLLGYSAVGIVREHVLPMALGEGGNGKGVLFETIKSVLGEYAAVSPPNFLMKQQFQGHTTDLAMLQGTRFVLNDEVDPRAKYDEAKVKLLAGGNSITARFMRQDNFTFEPTHQIWLSLNHRPGVDDGGESFWRRVRAVPFTHIVPDDQKDPGLKGRLVAEAGPKVLAWVARGAAMYYREGLQEPEAVRAATAAYAHDVDTVARFLEDECELGEADADLGPFATSYYTNCNALKAAYERYCRGNGDDPLQGRNLQIALAKHKITTGPGVPKGPNGQRQYAGVRLTSTLYRPADHHEPTEESTADQQGKLSW